MTATGKISLIPTAQFVPSVTLCHWL